VMFFSRVRIDDSSCASASLLKVFQGDVYDMHQLIWKLFPHAPDKKRDFLFRQEFEKEQLSFSDTRRGMPLFYVVSHDKPVAVDGLLSVETKEYKPKLSSGDRLGFDIRVNPVVARKTEGKKNSSKHNILMDAKLRARTEGITDTSEIQSRIKAAVHQWLTSKGKKGGFAIENQTIEISGSYKNVIRRNGSENIMFNSIDLSGVLTVTDASQFQDVLFKGIGHSKSFGCGLMMVRRIS